MAFNGSLSYPDGGGRGRGLCFGRLPFIGILLRRSVLPQASAVHAARPRLSASIHLSRLSAASKAKWKSKHGIPRPVPIPNSISFKLIQLFKNARGKTVHCFILIRRFGTSLIFSTITNPSEVSSPPPPSAAFAFLVTVRLRLRLPRRESILLLSVPFPFPSSLPSMLFFLPSLVKCEMDFSCENNFFPPQFATAYK